MRLVVTGASSHLARAAIPHLLRDGRITRIDGIDLKGPLLHDARYQHHPGDFRAPGIAALLDGADTLLHLGFVVMRGDLGRQRNDRGLMRAINVEGTASLVETAARVGVARVVYLSSASVYRQTGSSHPLAEHAERGPLAGFFYAEDKAAVEDWLDGFAPSAQGMRIVRLRPHAILGPRAQPALKRLAGSRIYPRYPDPAPMLQCVHETDVAAAIGLAVHLGHSDAFNLATDDALSLLEITRRHGRFAVGVPPALVEWLTALAWRLHIGATDASWMGILRAPLVIDNRHAREALGWQPQYARLLECLAAV